MELGIADDSEGAGHEQAAQIAVPLFADTAKPIVGALSAPQSSDAKASRKAPGSGAKGQKNGRKPPQGITLHHEGQYLHKKLPGKMKSGQ